jgi:hypothetical protein
MAYVQQSKKLEKIFENGEFVRVSLTITDTRWPNSPITIEVTKNEVPLVLDVNGDLIGKVAVGIALRDKIIAKLKAMIATDAARIAAETADVVAAAKINLAISDATIDAAIQSAGG